MILIKPSYNIITIMNHIVGGPEELIEICGRTCYKSEDKITKDSAPKFVQKLNELGHHSVIEHSAMTVKFICDRGVSHELVRHRLASYSQESTRYCNYKGGVTFIIPPWVMVDEGEYELGMYIEAAEETLIWLATMWNTENNYIDLLKLGWSPQEARSVLPNSLKTEVIVTANFREWLHILRLRTSPKAHPQMRELMIPLAEELSDLHPSLFGEFKCLKNAS